MKKLEDTLVVHIKSIFDLPKSTSHRRILAALGEPEIKMRLAVRLLKNWHKYKENFGDYPLFYEETLLKYFENKNLYPNKVTDVNFKTLRDELINNNVRDSALNFLPCRIRDDHREFLKKHIFNWPDLRNWHLIRYFTHTTKGTCGRLFPKCQCGSENTPNHGANECTLVLSKEKREKIFNKFKNLYKQNGLMQRDTLYDFLHSTFFTIEKVENNKCLKILVDLMKTTILEIITNDKSIDGRLIKNLAEEAEEQNKDEVENLEESIMDIESDSD